MIARARTPLVLAALTCAALAVLTGCASTRSADGRPASPGSSAPAQRGEAATDPSPPPPPSNPQPATADTAAALTIAAVGDIMLGTDYPKKILPDDDGVSFLTHVAPVLSAADVAFGNLEGVLMDGGEPVKQCRDPAFCFLFRTPARYAQHLRAAGFDVMSLANNHARDFGEAGRDSSMRALDAVGILHSGREGTHASWAVQGLRVAMIAFAPNVDSNPLLDLEWARARVAELAASHDVVVASFHGGAEGDGAERLPFARELYRGEDRGDVVEFARAMVDAGADLVIGHGPHVPRALELYRERLIAYSLGNFATYYGISVEGQRGLAPILVATLDPEGRFLSGRIESMIQIRPGGPQPDPERRAAAMMRELTSLAFPQSAIEILEDGALARAYRITRR
jgi:hypothetical protein